MLLFCHLVHQLVDLIQQVQPSACDTSQPAPPAAASPTIELPSPATEPTENSELTQPLTETTYPELLTTYSIALNEKWDVGTLMEKGFDPLLADCYGDAPLENIGYAIMDLDGDGIEELAIGTTKRVTDEFYLPDTEQSVSALELPILEEIDQSVTVGTTGSYMTAVQAAVKLLNWGTNTGLDPEEIREEAVAWLAGKGNDEQTAFGEKLALVDEVYQKLLTDDAETLLASAGLEGTERSWLDSPVEPIEAIMEAVGLR